VTLRFDDWASTQEVLSQLLSVEPHSGSGENETLCPRLSELRLDLGWEFSELPASKEWLIDAMQSRNNVSVIASASIYVGWKGEGNM
jgi:hypothetical protein